MSDWFEGYSCRCSDGSQCQTGLRDILIYFLIFIFHDPMSECSKDTPTDTHLDLHEY